MADEQYAGRKAWKRPLSPYEEFMEEQDIPIHRGIGFRNTLELPRKPWRRMGGEGAFLELDGTGGIVGVYLIEVPAGGALHPEHHLYEEMFFVLEGRGATEIWVEGSPKRQSFEWQKGSLFTVPLNTWHQIVNASSSPAVLLVETNAPPVMQLFRNREFIFGTPFHFSDRYDLSDDYFKPWQEVAIDPLSHRAINAGALIPDAVNCELPFDGQRGSGHHHFFLSVGHRTYGNLLEGGMQPGMAGNFSGAFIAEYPPAHYSKIHAHESGPVLLCLKGEGYLLTWPTAAGTRPWEAGNAHLVKRVDYTTGGVVSAAPGGAQWFHGHFAVSKEPYRVMAYLGGYPKRIMEPPGGTVTHYNEDINRGGTTIEYSDEDPVIRKTFKEELEKRGASSQMPQEVYR